MLVVAVCVAAAVTLGVGLMRGLATAAATCVLTAVLLIPPVAVGSTGLPLTDAFVLAGLAALVLWHGMRQASPVSWQWFDLVVGMAIVMPTFSAWWHTLHPPTALMELADMMAWLGAPYVAGRVLLADGTSFKRAAMVILVALTLYAPLCLVESLVQPPLAERVFGLKGTSSNATAMFFYYWGPDGYRPCVFASNFFQLAMIQVAAVVLGFGMWRARGVHREGRIVLWRGVAALAFAVNLAALLCLSRSWAGVILPVAALGLLGALMLTRWRVWVLLACMVMPVYVGLRAYEVIPTAPLPLRHTDGSEFLAGRGRSINTRMTQEQQVLDAVGHQQPWIGTGARYRIDHDRFRIATKSGVDSGVFTALLRSGYIGLVLLWAALVLPAVLLVVRLPTASWSVQYGPLLLAAAVVIVTDAVNLIPNSGSAALYPLLGGALVTLSRRRSTDLPVAMHDDTTDTDYQRWALVCGMPATEAVAPVHDRSRRKALPERTDLYT